MEGGEEEVARSVAGEEPTRAVGPVGRWGEAEDDDPRPGVTEAGDGPAPVALVPVSCLLLPGDLLAPLDEARAKAAGGYLPFERGEPGEGCGARLLSVLLVQAP